MVKEKFLEIKEKNLDSSLDQLLYYTYQSMSTDLPFEQVKDDILSELQIDEMEYYLKDVDPKLRSYVEENVFQLWELMIRDMVQFIEQKLLEESLL